MPPNHKHESAANTSLNSVRRIYHDSLANLSILRKELSCSLIAVLYPKRFDKLITALDTNN